jgi:hypothetical protein
MPLTIIKLTYRQLIDPSSEDQFEKKVLHYSYEEFLLKSQVYNPEGKFKSFTEMKANDGRANSLHYKSGFAVDGFISALKNTIPKLKDNLGKALSFENYSFELVESDISDRTKHSVAIHYSTPRLILHKTIGEFMVLGKDDETTRETFTLQISKDLAVTFFDVK